MSTLSIVILVLLLAYTAWQAVNIIRSEPVEAELTGYEEEEHYDSSQGFDVTNVFPVYRYTWNGRTHTYRMPFSSFFSVLRRSKASRRIYVRADGKVFCIENAVVSLLIACILFFIG